MSILSIMVTSFIYGSNKSSAFGLKFMYVPTESMETTIHKGQFIVGTPIDPANIQVGDIVTYVNSSAGNYENIPNIIDYLLHGKGTTYPVVHRVVAITEDGNFIFKGDNNKFKDGKPVKPEQIGYKIIFY